MHPDSFAGAILEGREAGNAKVLSTSTKVALPELEKWAERHTTREDLLVLEVQRERFCGGAAAARLKTSGRDPGQSPGGASGQSLFAPTIGWTRSRLRASTSLDYRPGVATRRPDPW